MSTLRDFCNEDIRAITRITEIKHLFAAAGCAGIQIYISGMLIQFLSVVHPTFPHCGPLPPV
jgi:hypothetical protein